MENSKQDHLAVLIDSDNTSSVLIAELLTEIAKYGVASVKRAYGDWTTTQLKGWKEKLHEFAIQPIQQFSYTTGKNSTDSALIIDAMDLLYTEKFDGFCIVSSDSDFTRLATRVRETGLVVYGFGAKKTPKPFVSACDKFIYTEILVEEDESPQKKEIPAKKLKQDTKLVTLLRGANESCADEEGWAHLAQIGQQISKNSPDFDPRNYGYQKLKPLLEATELFEINEVKEASYTKIFVRSKKKL
ncbi:NYN domain-containing protein [Deltaproteobacteria bacterium TL4]